MRLHLSRTHTAATTPSTRSAASAAPATRNSSATTAAGARAPMGCVVWSGTTPDGSAGPGPSSASVRLGTVVLDCPDPHALARFYAGLLGQPVDPDGDDDWQSLAGNGSGVALAWTRSFASRFESGSSMRKTRGSRTIARASATRCCSPPDSRPGRRGRRRRPIAEHVGHPLDFAWLLGSFVRFRTLSG